MEGGHLDGIVPWAGATAGLACDPGRESPAGTGRVEDQVLLGEVLQSGVGGLPGCVPNLFAAVTLGWGGGQVGQLFDQWSGPCRQVLERCTYVSPVEQAGARSGVDRDVGVPEGGGDRVGLRVGSHQDRLVRPPAVGSLDLARPSGNSQCLGLVVVVFGDAGLGAAGPVRLHRFLPDQQRSGGAENLGSAPVVPVEFHDLGVSEVGAEPDQVVGVGAVPPVDGLVGVSDHTEVGAAAEPGGKQGKLEGVDVLELVHVEVAETPPLGVPKRSVTAHQPSALVQQIIEVH